MIKVRLLLDSINHHGERLTTLELEYPRYIHSEFMTHRVFSRNAQSSRAIPVEKLIERVKTNPVMPIFMENQKGMAASKKLEGLELEHAQTVWLEAKDAAILYAEELNRQGIHKQVVNRILEPFSTIKVIVSSTEWDNFFKLRIAPDAQQEICELATQIKQAMDVSEPKLLNNGEWHLPLLRREDHRELTLIEKIKVSVARCARVSYLTHNGLRDIQEDIKLYDRLLESKHMSPFEHVACPLSNPFNRWSSNFKGWLQHRTLVENSNYISSQYLPGDL